MAWDIDVVAAVTLGLVLFACSNVGGTGGNSSPGMFEAIGGVAELTGLGIRAGRADGTKEAALSSPCGFRGSADGVSEDKALPCAAGAGDGATAVRLP